MKDIQTTKGSSSSKKSKKRPPVKISNGTTKISNERIIEPDPGSFSPEDENFEENKKMNKKSKLGEPSKCNGLTSQKAETKKDRLIPSPSLKTGVSGGLAAIRKMRADAEKLKKKEKVKTEFKNEILPTEKNISNDNKLTVVKPPVENLTKISKIDEILNQAKEKVKQEAVKEEENLLKNQGINNKEELAELERVAEIEAQRKNRILEKRRRLYAAIQITKRQKIFKCPDCMLEFGQDLKAFYAHLRTDHYRTADYKHYDGKSIKITSVTMRQAEKARLFLIEYVSFEYIFEFENACKILSQICVSQTNFSLS